VRLWERREILRIGIATFNGKSPPCLTFRPTHLMGLKPLRRSRMRIHNSAPSSRKLQRPRRARADTVTERTACRRRRSVKQGQPWAQDELKDENGRKTPVQAGVAPNGDEQEAKRGKGQAIVS
jgi:hypothetical protein